MRAAVEDDAAVRTDDVREAGRLPGPGGSPARHVLLTEPALDRRSEPALPALGVEHPWSQLEGRLVTHVSPVPAGKLGYPQAVFVLKEADDRTLHCVRVRPGITAAVASGTTGSSQPVHQSPQPLAE